MLPLSRYYAVCFLNQLQLSQQMSDLAARLITIYFSFFKVFVKKGEVDSKMLSALLTGVNRAYPFAKGKRSVGIRVLLRYFGTMFLWYSVFLMQIHCIC